MGSVVDVGSSASTSDGAVGKGACSACVLVTRPIPQIVRPTTMIPIVVIRNRSGERNILTHWGTLSIGGLKLVCELSGVWSELGVDRSARLV